MRTYYLARKIYIYKHIENVTMDLGQCVAAAVVVYIAILVVPVFANRCYNENT